LKVLCELALTQYVCIVEKAGSTTGAADAVIAPISVRLFDAIDGIPTSEGDARAAWPWDDEDVSEEAEEQIALLVSAWRAADLNYTRREMRAVADTFCQTLHGACASLVVA
jgi:hypothetical protein